MPAKTRKRQPTEVRRLLIVDAAREIIGVRGLFATTMRDIAQAADVSLGTVTYHFDGIAEILREVLAREMALFYEPIVAKAREADRGLDALQVLVDCFFADDERTRQHWRLWLDFWSVAAHEERYADWKRRTYLRWRADVLDMITRAGEQGDLRAGDPGTVVADFLALFDGSAVQAFLPRSPVGPDDARAHLTDWLRRASAPARPRRRRSTP